MFASNRKKFLPHKAGYVVIPLLTILGLSALGWFLTDQTEKTVFIYQNDTERQIPPFRTKDINGHTVTQDILAGQFTVVCLWVTRDADTGQKLLATLDGWRISDNVPFRLVGLIGDMKEDADPAQIAAAQVVANACPDAVQLVVNDELAPLLTRIRNAPTVFFVGEHGRLIGQPVVGNEPLLVQKEILRLLQADSAYGKLGGNIHRAILFAP